MVAKTATHPMDRTLMALVLGLSVFGLVMVYSSSFYIAVNENLPQTYYLLRQLMWLVIGAAGMYVAHRIHYRWWRKIVLPSFIGTLVLLVATLVLPESVTAANGATRWIRIGSVQFQPTEIAKFVLILYLSAWLVTRRDKLRSTTAGLMPFVVVVGLFCGLVVMQPNLSSAAMLGLIAIAIYFAAGANIIHMIAGIVSAGGLGWFVVQAFGHSSSRLRVFEDPWLYPRDGGWQPVHSLYALASGSLFGRGLGQSRQKFLWLPFAHSDAIFSVIGEELGLLGTLVVMGAFVLLAYRGYRIAARARDPFAGLMAVGITSWITFQAFLNMAVVSSLIPYTGQTLPFISYGGTSLAMCMFAMGVLLNISKHVDEQPNEPEISPVVQRPASEPRQRPAIGLVPALSAALRRRNGRPRVSGTDSSVSFTRSHTPPTTVSDERGWRRLTGNVDQKSGRKPAKSRSASRSGGTWRSR